jgi:hypothetical protein
MLYGALRHHGGLHCYDDPILLKPDTRALVETW